MKQYKHIKYSTIDIPHSNYVYLAGFISECCGNPNLQGVKYAETVWVVVFAILHRSFTIKVSHFMTIKFRLKCSNTIQILDKVLIVDILYSIL